ncbi:hypothetical protein [Hoyosella altamirensis]|uniref:Uncharacterized protein n=1 Tax=Hoyosella altamirensis TaxID=616997 RepID=A0A839RU87_9ACTN|nr:hypothetical protein [Hoyosella altamirensis]MBB3040130.1 hypothetical protein [Hoyosella altamirensis]
MIRILRRITAAICFDLAVALDANLIDNELPGLHCECPDLIGHPADQGGERRE